MLRTTLLRLVVVFGAVVGLAATSAVHATFVTSGSSRRIPLELRSDPESSDGSKLIRIAYSVDGDGNLFVYRTFSRSVGYLGVVVDDLDQGTTGVGEEPYNGLRVVRVADDSPATGIGLREGDVILAVGERQLSNKKQFPVLIKYQSIETPVHLHIQRGHERLSYHVQLAEREEESTDIDRVTLPSYPDTHTGCLLGELSGSLASHFFDGGGSGVVVMNISPGSPAFYSDLRRGDIITAVGDSPVDRPATLDALLGEAAGQEVTLAVRRGEEPLTATVEPEEELSEGFRFSIPIVINVEKRLPRTEFELGLGLLLNYERSAHVDFEDEPQESYEFGALLNLIHYESTPTRREFSLLWLIRLKFRR